MQTTPVSRIGSTDRHEVMILDPAILQGHRAWRAKGPWHGGFTVAAWLRFPEGLIETVQLMLSFRDQERRKSYLIDQCLPNRQTLILLNGAIGVSVRGEVSDMSLCLTGPSENAVWMLDECRIEPMHASLGKTSPGKRSRVNSDQATIGTGHAGTRSSKRS